MAVTVPTEMIESVLQEVRNLLKGMPDEETIRPMIILIHGQQNSNNDLRWTGPFSPDDVEEYIEEEMLAGAAIVFSNSDEISIYKSIFNREDTAH